MNLDRILRALFGIEIIPRDDKLNTISSIHGHSEQLVHIIASVSAAVEQKPTHRCQRVEQYCTRRRAL